MQRPKVDLKTAEAVRLLLLQCQQQGRDPIRVLDERGYLHSVQLEAHIRAEALDAAATLLDRTSLDAVLRDVPDTDRPMTPFATKQVISKWLQHLASLQSNSSTSSSQPTSEEKTQ